MSETLVFDFVNGAVKVRDAAGREAIVVQAVELTEGVELPAATAR